MSIHLGVLVAIVVKDADSQTVSPTFCTAQSAVTTFSSLVSFFLTVAIAFFLFVSVFHPENTFSSFVIGANIVSWGVPGKSSMFLIKTNLKQ